MIHKRVRNCDSFSNEKIKKEKQYQEGSGILKSARFSGTFFERGHFMVRTESRAANKTRDLVLGAFFMALGIVMPFLTGQIPGIGSRLLPMHIPVLLCGYVCGWQYGLIVGFVTPLLRSMMFSMPPMMPTAVGMAFEMATYGAVTGILYQKLPKTAVSVYLTLIVSMLAGRLVWGLVSIALYGVSGGTFSWQIFMAGAFVNAVPGILLQLALIPVIIITLQKAKVIGS